MYSNAYMDLESEDISKFWTRVNKQDSEECWNWLGAKDINGYGKFSFLGRTILAHRLAWKITYGDIPEGLLILHKCNNSSCVNPQHLYVGNQSNNMLDRTKSGYSHKETMIRHGVKYNSQKQAMIRNGFK